MLTLKHRKTAEVDSTPVQNQSTEESDEDFEEGEIKDQLSAPDLICT